MNVEIICVGTELLLGDILNTNAKFLSESLAEMGFNLFSQSVVGDNPERLKKQIELSLSRSDIVILSGGLGPTEDDITKETVANVLNLPMEMNEECLKSIQKYFDRTGRKMSENNKKQALIIKGSTVLDNDHGTAPGLWVKSANGIIIMLPGPPSELIPMFNNKAVPLLKSYSSSTIYSKNVRIFGVGESSVAELCGDLLQSQNPTVATYAKTGEVDIRVTASASNYIAAENMCSPVVEKLEEIFGEHIYGIDVQNLQQRVVDLLKEKHMKVATAESCTAGLLSGRITEIPGSSEVFEMGVTAYANYVKVQALGVDEHLIDKKGAVSHEVAAQMAIGIRTMCGADIGVGITGVAGPGQSEGKPAGLVYIAIADSEKVYVRKIMGRGSDRENTRILATSTALDMVRRYLEQRTEFLSYGTNIGENIRLMEGYTIPKVAVSNSIKSKTETKNQENPPTIYTDEEMMDMFNRVNTEPVEVPPEKLEIETNSADFIFDDEEETKSQRRNIFLTKNKEYDDTQLDLNSYTDDRDAPKKRGFFASLFPCKGDSVSEKIRKIIFIVAFLTLIGTMGYLINYFVEGWDSRDKISDAAAVWEADDSMEKNEKGIFIGFESLLKQNSDIRAWIKIDGTNINNPVYKTYNNQFYVEHDMNKQSSRYGALFIDKSAIINKDKNSQNVVIYGHHMKDGTMFGPLKNYTDISFYKKHPIVDFTTLYREGQYKVFAVFITNTLEEHDNGEIFNYRKQSFADNDAFLQFVDDCKKRSIIDTGVEVLGDDEIITLSTCTYEFEEARLVVMARRIREGETNLYYTKNAKVNPNPLYPQIWYEVKGGKKPVFSSTPEITSEGFSGTISSDDAILDVDASAESGGNTTSNTQSRNTVTSKTGGSSSAASISSSPAVSSKTSSKANTVSSATSSKGAVTSAPSKPAHSTSSVTSSANSSKNTATSSTTTTETENSSESNTQ